MEYETLKLHLVEELRKEVEPLVEEIKRSTEATKELTSALTTLQAARQLHGLLLQEVLVYQLMSNLDPLNKAQRHRSNIIALIEKHYDSTEPVHQAVLSQALTFFDQLVAVFEKAEEDRPSLVC